MDFYKRLGEFMTPYEKSLRTKEIFSKLPQKDGKVIYAAQVFLRKRNEAMKSRLNIQTEEQLCKESQALLAQSMHGLTERW
jgi:hypothetical protein